MTDNNAMFGVYIHWPFCAQKCPYCDFNSHVRFGGWDEARFLAAYKRELDWVAESTSPPPAWGRWRVAPEGVNPDARRHGVPSPLAPPHKGEGKVVSSIFFGGGTPSLMKPETVGAILNHIAKLWTIDANAEITLEANPGSVEAERFKGYRAAGVNRVSMGLQSLRDDELKKLGRIHTVAEAKAALAIARDTFQRFSFDLIYARPAQTPQQWRAELTEALELAGDHLSLYQLTIEPDTPYAALHAAGKLIVPDADAAAELYEITADMTAAKGYAAYEVSNYAAPGAESRHNLLYWRYGEYAGVGPGAHGRLMPNPPSPCGEGIELGGIRAAGNWESPPASLPHPEGGDLTRFATVAERNPEAWVARVEAHGHGFTELTELTRAEQADEMLLMGLRLTEGVDLERLARLGGVRPSRDAIRHLAGLGLLDVIPSQSSAPRGIGAGRASGIPGADADVHDDGLAPIRMCVGPGMAPAEEMRPAGAKEEDSFPNRIRATPRGRFVLNAVVAELSKSFEAADGAPRPPISSPLAAPPAMDKPPRSL